MNPESFKQLQQQLAVLAAGINRLDKEFQAIRDNQKRLHNYAGIVDAVAFGSMFYHEFGSDAEFAITDKKVKLTKKRIQDVLDKMNAHTEEIAKKQEEERKKNGKTGKSTIITN